MTPPLIHLGLHRTGSSWFQSRVLDGCDGRPRNAIEREESSRRLVLTRDMDFDAEAMRDWVGSHLEEATARDGHAVLSNERFSGNPSGGWFDAERVAERLAEVVPGARVLLVVREQRSWLRSIWLQYVRIGGVASIAGYLEPPVRGDHRLPVPDLGFARFDRYVDHLDGLFGRDRVLVLPYELLRRSPEAYLDRISNFSDIPLPAPSPGPAVYASPSTLECGVLRRINLLATRSSLNRGAPFPRLERAGRRLASAIGRFATRGGEARRLHRLHATVESLLDLPAIGESNRRLAARMEQPLAEFGYLLP